MGIYGESLGSKPSFAWTSTEMLLFPTPVHRKRDTALSLTAPPLFVEHKHHHCLQKSSASEIISVGILGGAGFLDQWSFHARLLWGGRPDDGKSAERSNK